MNESAAAVVSITKYAKIKRVMKWIAMTLGVVVLSIGLLLGTFSVVMARMPQYRAQMQSWLSERAKLNIQFATLQARWRWFGPELVFTDAVVRNADGSRTLVTAHSGGVGFDVWTALRTGRVRAGRFSLTGTELKAVRRPTGKFEIVGAADLPDIDTGEALDFDALPVGKITVNDVRLSFRDLKTGRGPWTVDNVQFTIERNSQLVIVEGQASLPAALGKQLHFSAHGEGSLAQVEQLKWQAQVSGQQVNLAGWAQVMPDDWIAPREGMGSFELSARFVGAMPHSMTGRISFIDVLMNPPQWTTPLPQADALQVREDDDAEHNKAVAPSGELVAAGAPQAPIETANSAAVIAAVPLRYSSVGLEFTTDYTAQGWLTEFKNVQFSRSDAAWAPGTASLLIKFADGQESAAISSAGSSAASSSGEPNASNRATTIDADAEPTRIERIHATAQFIRLDNLWPLLAYLPENESNARLRALNATGELDNLDVTYERAMPTDISAGVDSPPRYGLRADFKSLGASPVGSNPGISGLSGSIEATGAQGKLHLDSSDLALSIPRLFRTPLPIDRMAGDFDWTRSTSVIHIASNNFAAQTPDGGAHAQFTLDIPQQGSPVIDMRAQANDLAVVSAPRYMPAGIMQRRLLTWLDTGFTAGRVKQAQLTLKGPLQKFPFRDNSGLFLINADIEGLTLNYQPGWLPATGLQVQAEFRNVGVSATATAGTVNGLAIERAQGRISDYRNSEVEINAATRGDLNDALRYIQQSPVGPGIGDLFMQLHGRGNTMASVAMLLPLKDLAKRKVNVEVELQDAQAGLRDIAEQVTALNGKLHVFNDALTAAAINGEFLQGAVTIGTTAVDGNHFNVVADGHATSQTLTQFLHMPSFIKLGGELNYRFAMPGYAQHNNDGHRALFTVDSDLQGLSIDLPAPINKPASVARAMHVEVEARGPDVMQARAAYGDLRGLVRLQRANDSWRFERAGLRVDGIAAALPAQPGLRIDGSMAEFTLDDWLKLSGNNAANASAAGGMRRVQDVLRAANVNVGRFHLYGFEWPDLRGILQATDAGWRIDVAGPDASGQLIVPYNFDGPTPLIVDMDQLNLTSVKSSGAVKPTQRTDPRDLPALRVAVKDFQYGMHDFGNLQATATRTAQGLQVNSIQVKGNSFAGDGMGSWLKTDSGQQSSLGLTVESTDVRETLQQFKYADFIAAKHGKLEAQLGWPGGLEDNPLARASGTIELQVDDGQLLSVQPGAGRVLGLLSVAALPRRLRLDFRDVTDKGLSFDSIHGNFAVSNGDAHTQNLLLSGTTADIGIVGRIGLGSRDYDQTAVVNGDVGSALPLAGAAIAANPVVGAALLLFTQVFKEPLKGVTRAYYHIGGSWDDPQIERVDSDVGKASMLTTTPAQELGK